MTDTKALVAAVRAHALANYNKDGWDVVVEAWDDEEIIEVIGKARTEKGAIKKVAYRARIYDAVRRDIQGA